MLKKEGLIWFELHTVTAGNGIMRTEVGKFSTLIITGVDNKRCTLQLINMPHNINANDADKYPKYLEKI